MAGVSSTHVLYDSLKEKWDRCRDVAEGSDAVKDKGIKYLPALDSHKETGGGAKYDDYKLRALFYNATGRTIDGLAGAIFQKAPAVENIDDVVKEHAQDITLTGEPLDMFALNVTKEYLTTGRYGILVDMSTAEAVSNRPYWVGYPAEDIVNWRFTRMGGDQELSLVVLRELVDGPVVDDEFCVDQLTQYRVLRLNGEIYTQQIYKEVKKDRTGLAVGSANIVAIGKKEFAPEPATIPLRRGKPLNFIPFSLPWTMGMPPLLDLVDTNLSHYRGYADLKHGLHFTALPTPWVSGLAGGATEISIGSGGGIALDVNGSAGMLEFTGKGLGAIRTDLQDMQRMMASLGARLLEEAPHYAETALSVSMRHSSDYATLRTIAQVVEQQLSWTLKVHSWWVSAKELVTDLKANVELNKIFFDAQLTADELRALLLALQSKSISYKTFYSRLSATGWTREGVAPEEELTDIDEQPDDIGIMPVADTGGNPPPQDPANPSNGPKLKTQKAGPKSNG